MSASPIDFLPGALLPWYEAHARDLPWRADREAYHVLVSEIMLQQTRVEAAIDHYRRFIAELPDVFALASVPPERLHKLWEGLGYYRRAGYLQSAAQQVVRDYDGVFPAQYDKIRALRGVGDYTAGAICSISFELPTPAVDGNVLRVFSRLLADETPVPSPAAQKKAHDLLSPIYPVGRCGDFTQSLMELGATVCIPNGAPRCEICPLRSRCLAARQNRAQSFPVKSAKKARRTENLTIFLLHCGDCVAIEKRPEDGLLAGLWQFPNVPDHLDETAALAEAKRRGVAAKALVSRVSRSHIFTHVKWDMRAYCIDCESRSPEFVWVDFPTLEHDYALPSAFSQFLDVIKKREA